MFEFALEHNWILGIICWFILAMIAAYVFGGIARIGRGADLETGDDLPPRRRNRVRKH